MTVNITPLHVSGIAKAASGKIAASTMAAWEDRTKR
jgi:hypothetical protein